MRCQHVTTDAVGGNYRIRARLVTFVRLGVIERGRRRTTKLPTANSTSITVTNPSAANKNGFGSRSVEATAVVASGRPITNCENCVTEVEIEFSPISISESGIRFEPWIR